MGFDFSSLESPSRLLKSFNNSTTRSRREMVLLVKVNPTTLNMQFSIVGDPYPYKEKLR